MTATLAALRYRRVCDEEGGPIAALETGPFDLRGEMVWQANATLKEELAPKRGAVLFSPVDGSGTHRTAVVARHIAVSEAIERWALICVLRDGIGELLGFGAGRRGLTYIEV